MQPRRAYRSDEAVTVRHGIQFDMKNGKRSATQRFVNHYLKKDGTAYTETELATMEFSAQFQNRDPRLAQTIHGPNYVAVAETAHETLDWERTLNGYRVIKYISDISFTNDSFMTGLGAKYSINEKIDLNFGACFASYAALSKGTTNYERNTYNATVGVDFKF